MYIQGEIVVGEGEKKVGGGGGGWRESERGGL